MPSATFEMGGSSQGGSVTEITYTEDFSSSKGANFVTAVTQTQADNSRPQQVAFVADPRRPALEYRWSPSTSILDNVTLLAHAQQQLGIMQNGSRTLTLKSDATSGPKLGVDWFTGDTVNYSIGGQDQYGAESVPAFPGGPSGVAGLAGSARVIAWTIDPDSMTPQVSPILGGL